MEVKMNEKQLKAVQSIQKSNLIVAPAGTGKTACVAEKIAYIQQQYSYPGILTLSFSKRAVAEIETRIKDHTHVRVSNLCAFFLSILRQHGFKSYQIVTDDRTRLMAASLAIARTGLTKKIEETALLDAMDTCKLAGDVKKAAAEYFRILKQSRQMDFNAVSYYTLELLKNNPAICRKYQAMFRFVMVDEAQDLNEIMYSIIRLLFPGNRTNVDFVGDPRQAIMSWRGAVANVLTLFQKDYKADVYELDLNYRSSPEIIRLANDVQSEYAPLIATRPSTGLQPVFHTAQDAEAEGDFIIQEIRSLISGGTHLKDIAVLYRSMPAAVTVYEKLLESELPVVKVGYSFFRWGNSPFRELRSLLNLLVAPSIRDFQYCSRLFDIDAANIRNIARRPEFKEAGLSDLLSFLIQNVCNQDDAEEKRNRLRHLTDLLNQNVKAMTLRDTICKVWDFFLRSYFEASDDGILDKYLSATKKFSGLDEMLSHARKMEKQMAMMAKFTVKPGSDYLTMESIHSAKGLEYPYVFLCGCADGILPDTSHEEENLTEERNLAYTSITRGRERVYISYAARSERSRELQQPSRFFAHYFNGYEKTHVMESVMVAETK